ncbi:MAG: metallophosphoesterase [Clostridia bacterium]|nr:metallophosphoesterase [Clostridia bacterium]
MSIKFGVLADLHVDIMHDCEERLKVFLDVCKKENVDFIIQLGDFCYPDIRDCICKPENTPENVLNALNMPTYVDKDKIISMYRDFEKPSYHVIGNHDCDMCSKEQILEYYGVDYGPYYSFDMGGFHFVILDPNYMKLDGKYVSYDRGNYFDESYRPDKVIPYLPDEQIKWLENDLANTKYPSVLFTHQCLTDGHDGNVLNWKDVKKVIDSAPNKVVMALNGHEHTDLCEKVDGVWYYTVNCMSNMWVGKRWSRKDRYPAEVYEKFPSLEYVVPYENSQFAIITMDEKGAQIKGTKGGFVGASPKDMGMEQKRVEKIVSDVKDRYLSFE